MRNILKQISLWIIVLIGLLWLTACVSVVNFNIGSGINTHSVRDDQILGQQYDAKLTQEKK